MYARIDASPRHRALLCFALPRNHRPSVVVVLAGHPSLRDRPERFRSDPSLSPLLSSHPTTNRTRNPRVHDLPQLCCFAKIHPFLPPIHRGTKMNWVSRKIHLYNVTMGLYMLDWWERCVFNILMVVLLWFICYNTSRSATDFYNSHIKSKFFLGESFTVSRNIQW